ncbi:MAG: hypothetical protein M9938_08230 [Solirubrobacterales bacterium]|nr:hypothetical protein [Solirubrobacterales bacterium]
MVTRGLFPLRSSTVARSSLPFREPYVTARGRLDHRETVLLSIRSASGMPGLGEAVPLSLRGGESAERVEAQLHNWCFAAEAAEAADEAWLSTSRKLLGRPARCAVQTALADVRARERGIPLHDLLFSIMAAGDQAASSRPPEPVLCNATLSSGSPDEVRRQAENWAGAGFTTFKLKLGPEGDQGQVAALRESLGDRVKIRLDVNGSWSVEQAAREILALADHAIELVEQPVASLEEMARLRELVPVPLVADESVSSEADARRAAELGACDAATVKLSKIGNLDPTLGGHLPTYLSSALDGPVGMAAASHVAVTLRRLDPDGPWAGVAQGLATQRLFEAEHSSIGPTLDGPWLTPPVGPGLGVNFDLPE